MTASLLLGLCPLLAVGSTLHDAPAPAYPWACKNGDALRTGSSVAAAIRAVGNGPTWSFHEEPDQKLFLNKLFRAKSLVRSVPLIDDKKNIFLSTVTTGNVYKFTADGGQLWKYSAGKGRQIPDIPALMDGRLFLTTSRGEVIALDMDTATECWRAQAFKFSAGDTWAMSAGEGVVIAAGSDLPGANNRLLSGLNATTGMTLWSFRSPHADLYNVLVAIKDGSAVFSDSQGAVFRLNLFSGKEIWRTHRPAFKGFTTGGTIIGPNGVVYTTWNEGSQPDAPRGRGMVGAFDFDNGAQLWNTSVDYAANNAAVVGRLPTGRLALVVGVGSNPDVPMVPLGIRDGKGPVKQQRIVALDAETGKLSWTYQLPDWHGSALGDEHRADICLPDAFGNAAMGGDGTAYIGHASGLLYSIRDDNSDGEISQEEVSTWQAGAAFQGTPAIAPGMLAATPCNGLHVWRF